MSQLYNMKSAFSLCQSLYGVDPNPDDFDDLAMTAWSRIGNKHTRLYRFVGNTENKELKLPCNVVHIESVHIPLPDAQLTSNKTLIDKMDSLFIEKYIDGWKFLEDPLSSRGRLVKYREGNNTLYFSRDYDDVKVIYHGVIADEDDGSPLINEKEMEAIAAYVAYTETFKDGVRRRDKNSFVIAQTLKEEWLRRCNAARSVEHLSQNDMNTILDVKYRWDRKQYGQSYIPKI